MTFNIFIGALALAAGLALGYLIRQLFATRSANSIETKIKHQLEESKVQAKEALLEAKDKEISRLSIILEKAFNWFPLFKEMLRMEKMCYAIGFTKDMINSLLIKKEAIRCNGKIYSEEYKRKFEIKNDTFKVEKSSVDDNKLVLTINKQPISEWFKEQWERLQQAIRKSVQTERKSRGFRM